VNAVKQPSTLSDIVSRLAVQGVFMNVEELTSILDDNPNLFVRNQSMPVTYARSAAAPASSAPARPRAVTPGSLQRSWKPRFAAAPFRMSWTALTAGVLPANQSWGELLAHFQETVAGFEYDELVLQVRAQSSGPAVRDFQIHIERVVDETPYWVGWIVSRNARLNTCLFDCGWHGWDVRRPARWKEPKFLLGRIALASGGVVVFTWRAETPFAIARAVLGTLHDEIAVQNSQQLKLDVVRPSAGELARRRKEMEHHEHVGNELTRRGFKGHKNPVRGMCALCGRPLRDPDSHRRGIGPVCWEKVKDLKLTLHQTRTDIPASHWVGAQPEQKWRDRLQARLQAVAARQLEMPEH
jgi:hypothetical protein